MNELAKKAYWNYKRESQKEKKLTEELMRAANEVVDAKNDKERDEAYKRMCSIQNVLNAVEREVNALARLTLDSLPENSFE